MFSLLHLFKTLYLILQRIKDDTVFFKDFAVKMWLNGGTPKEKLIMGMASYGRSFILNNTSETGLGAPTSGQGTAGSTTREKGFLSYYEVSLI